MADFRKWFPVLAIVALFIGSAMTASAQGTVTCNTSAGVPPIVRAEGLSELTGDVVLTCTGGTPTAAGTQVPQVNVQIFLNTNVTSKLTADPFSEAMLIIDEPTPANQRLCAATAGLTACNSALGVGSPGLNYAGAGTQTNVYQGRQVGANSIIWQSVPIDPPGTNNRIIRLTNVRGNANQLGSSSTLVPTQIVMNIAVNSTQSIAINNPQQIVAFIQPGMAFSVRSGTDSTTLFSFLQCVSNDVNLSTNTAATSFPTIGGIQGRSLLLRYTENFPTAFKVRASPAPLIPGSPCPTGVCVGTVPSPSPGYSADVSPAPTPQDTLSPQFNTESGYYGPAISGLPNTPGIATQGTRLLARFNNIPAGVSLFATVYEVIAGSSNSAFQATGGNTTATTSRARLVSTDLNGAGSFSPTPATSTLDGGLAPLTVSGGTATAVWEVTAANPGTFEAISFGISAAFTANTSANLPGLGTGTVNGNFAPISTVTTASVGAPVPRFADSSTSRTGLVINACTTNLLFPFLTNQLGFDSGFVISNTSVDPFGTSPQTGACKLNYYGGTTGGGAAPAAQTSAAVAGGAQLTGVLSTGGNLGIAATPGFQGYMIAQCAFQYAHGFAFISDVGSTRLAESYLALILDTGIPSRTLFASEVLGH